MYISLHKATSWGGEVGGPAKQVYNFFQVAKPDSGCAT